MGQNTSANYEKSFRKQKKALKTNGFQGFDGGDKRDRTADLLNAIQALSSAETSVTPRKTAKKSASIRKENKHPLFCQNKESSSFSLNNGL